MKNGPGCCARATPALHNPRADHVTVLGWAAWNRCRGVPPRPRRYWGPVMRKQILLWCAPILPVGHPPLRRRVAAKAGVWVLLRLRPSRRRTESASTEVGKNPEHEMTAGSAGDRFRRAVSVTGAWIDEAHRGWSR